MSKGYRYLAALTALLLLLAGCRGMGGPGVDYDALVRQTLAREYSFTMVVTPGSFWPVRCLNSVMRV